MEQKKKDNRKKKIADQGPVIQEDVELEDRFTFVRACQSSRRSSRRMDWALLSCQNTDGGAGSPQRKSMRSVLIPKPLWCMQLPAADMIRRTVMRGIVGARWLSC